MSCFYCRKKDYIVVSCPVLNKQNAKPVALVNTFDTTLDLTVVPEVSSELMDFASFVMDGVFSLPGNGPRVPVKMLRDTAASQFFILEGVLQFSDDSAVGSDVPVLDFGMKDIDVPLHMVFVESDLVFGEVAVEVRPQFPIKAVAFLLGNELAEGKVLVTRSMSGKEEKEICLGDSCL